MKKALLCFFIALWGIGICLVASGIWRYQQELPPATLTAVEAQAAAALELARIPSEAPLSLIIEPQDGTAPLTQAITGATAHLDLVIYELDDPAIEQALADAAHRGVAVRVMLDNLNTFGAHPNQAAFDFFKSENVPVEWSPSHFPLTHQKTLVVDGTAYVMTFNLTPRYYATSRDFALIDTDTEDVAAIEAAFNSDWGGKELVAENATDLVWSPGAAPVMLALIASASSTLDVYNEEMADPRITATLEAAAKRGIAVRVDMTYATNWKSALNELTEAGVLVRTYASTATFYIHAKAIIADGKEAFGGTENFSPQSLDLNRELGLLIKNPQIVATLEAAFATDWTSARVYTLKQ